MYPPNGGYSKEGRADSIANCHPGGSATTDSVHAKAIKAVISLHGTCHRHPDAKKSIVILTPTAEGSSHIFIAIQDFTGSYRVLRTLQDDSFSGKAPFFPNT